MARSRQWHAASPAEAFPAVLSDPPLPVLAVFFATAAGALGLSAPPVADVVEAPVPGLAAAFLAACLAAAALMGDLAAAALVGGLATATLMARLAEAALGPGLATRGRAGLLGLRGLREGAARRFRPVRVPAL